MNKLVTAICVFFVAACVVEARRCQYRITGLICGEQCCGEEYAMQCLESCENVTCSSDEDCGKSCCKNGRCGPPHSNGCEDTMTNIIIGVVAVVVFIALVTTVVLVKYYRRRRSPAPGMVILVNQ